jgi:hypothetical protein
LACKLIRTPRKWKQHKLPVLPPSYLHDITNLGLVMIPLRKSHFSTVNGKFILNEMTKLRKLHIKKLPNAAASSCVGPNKKNLAWFTAITIIIPYPYQITRPDPLSPNSRDKSAPLTRPAPESFARRESPEHLAHSETPKAAQTRKCPLRIPPGCVVNRARRRRRLGVRACPEAGGRPVACGPRRDS